MIPYFIYQHLSHNTTFDTCCLFYTLQLSNTAVAEAAAASCCFHALQNCLVCCAASSRCSRSPYTNHVLPASNDMVPLYYSRGANQLIHVLVLLRALTRDFTISCTASPLQHLRREVKSHIAEDTTGYHAPIKKIKRLLSIICCTLSRHDFDNNPIDWRKASSQQPSIERCLHFRKKNSR